MKSINSAVQYFGTKINNASLFVIVCLAMLSVAGTATAGGTATTIFDTMATATDAAIFGPLGQAIIGIGAAAGGLFAILKGAWLLAGLGIAIAGLMVGAQFVANSAGFGALI